MAWLTVITMIPLKGSRKLRKALSQALCQSASWLNEKSVVRSKMWTLRYSLVSPSINYGFVCDSVCVHRLGTNSIFRGEGRVSLESQGQTEFFLSMQPTKDWCWLSNDGQAKKKKHCPKIKCNHQWIDIFIKNIVWPVSTLPLAFFFSFGYVIRF